MNYTPQYQTELLAAYGDIVGEDRLGGQHILITGATGLIGSAAAELLLEAKKSLQKTYRVTLAGRNPQRLRERFAAWDGLFEAVSYDANEELAFTDSYDYIIHCAGNAHPALYASAPVETLLTAVSGTERILRYAKEHTVKRVLYVSSSEVYGVKPDNTPYREGDCYGIDMQNPRACYPIGKCAAENLCVGYYREYGVQSVIVRPGHIYGPTITSSDSRAHAQFLRNVIAGQDIVMKSAGLQLRSYRHAFDCASAMLTVLLCGNPPEAYNISNRDSVVTIRQFADMHAAVSGQKVVFDLPTDAEKAGYTLMTCSALHADKLYALGWTGRYDLERGVCQTVEASME